MVLYLLLLATINDGCMNNAAKAKKTGRTVVGVQSSGVIIAAGHHPVGGNVFAQLAGSLAKE